MKSKLQTLLKLYQNLSFAYLTLHHGNVFANTTKNFGVSIFYSYLDLAWTKHTSKKWFFGQNFQNLWQNWILIFCCTTSVGMLFLEFFATFLHKGFLEIWLGHGKRYRQTDGRTYREGKTIYVSRRGRHIIN